MSERFLDRPIPSSPYVYPSRRWELDKSGEQCNPVRVIYERLHRNPTHGQR